MSHLHFVGGEKGGIGKSVLARLLAQYFIDRNLPFRAFDTDRSHGALLRFYGSYSSPLELNDTNQADQLVDAALEQPQNILVDLAAQTHQALFSWIEEVDLLDLAQKQGIALHFWHLLDDGADALRLLQELLDRVGDRASVVIVKNHGQGEDFSLFERSPTLTAAQALSASVIDLPALNRSIMRKVDHDSLSFWAAANNSQAGLGLMERQRIRSWMARVYNAVDGVGPLSTGQQSTPALSNDIAESVT